MKENILKMLIRLLSKGSCALRGRRELPDPDTVRRVVVLQMSGIGDMLLITPAFRALHRIYPLASIDIITYKLKNAELLFRFPYIRGGCEFPLFDIELKRMWSPSFWRMLWKPVRFIKKEPTDIYVSFHHTWLPQWYLFELWIAAWSTVRFKVGINPDYIPYSGVFDRSVPESLLGNRHYCPFFLDIVNLLGEAGNDYSTEFPLEPHEIEEARTRIHTVMSDRKRVVCIHAGASFTAKLWPIDRFCKLAKMLEADGCGIVLIGTSEERELSKHIAEGLSEGNCLDATGNTNLFQMAALIDNCNLFIGNDSGPMHIAISRKCPAIGLIGPGKPRYYQYKPNEAVIIKNSILPDTKENKEIDFPWTITVEDVYEKARKLLS